eukprot:CAMPEP_0206220254 /NCGR_PEP_ID=MMETSP0047_2-20121206/4782_1 /ASSEMBLY_ACC=CAM_ASM_000192 /TAXON_ID=195065 /ORGANISM="Chroomonas mesostigmatica_cf, Strain CCMP1168" /LENGTH=32 /DNA_ID= /DNA_START= /DNA_END= /DNA_ORIENTATION=
MSQLLSPNAVAMTLGIPPKGFLNECVNDLMGL